MLPILLAAVLGSAGVHATRPCPMDPAQADDLQVKWTFRDTRESVFLAPRDGSRPAEPIARSWLAARVPGFPYWRDAMTFCMQDDLCRTSPTRVDRENLEEFVSAVCRELDDAAAGPAAPETPYVSIGIAFFRGRSSPVVIENLFSREAASRLPSLGREGVALTRR